MPKEYSQRGEARWKATLEWIPWTAAVFQPVGTKFLATNLTLKCIIMLMTCIKRQKSTTETFFMMLEYNKFDSLGNRVKSIAEHLKI